MQRNAILRRTPLKRTVFKKTVKKAPKKKVSRATKKPRIWSTALADRKFSLWIRERDGNRCVRCRTDQRLTNSHYWRRGHSGTRFEPDNCITLCVECHSEWEHLKNVDYKYWMFDWLGEERYNSLEIQARAFMKRTDAVIKCMVLIGK